MIAALSTLGIDLLQRRKRPYMLPFDAGVGIRILRPYGATRATPARASREMDRFHSGIDFATPERTPIVAAAAGRVMSVWADSRRSWRDAIGRRPTGRNDGLSDGYGSTIRILHADGRQTIYAHLRRIVVESGAAVRRGQLIGYSGHTGHTRGIPRLHFEARDKNFVAIDPAGVLRWA